MSAEAFQRHFASVPFMVGRSGDITFRDDGCWLMPSKSYIKVGPRSGRIYAHRLSLNLKLGGALGVLCALHACDEPRCINPDHLFAGTKADNSRDMARKGRWRNKPVRGIANNKATLTDEQIGEALTLVAAGCPVAAVARRFGVTPRAVQTWRDGLARAEAREKWLRGVAA